MRVYPERGLLQGMESEIWKLVSYSATPQQWKEWLRVPLKHAAARGNLNRVNSLLEAGADGIAGWKGAQWDVNVLSVSSKRSALYTATVCGHEDAARRLITAGADVNFDDPVHCSHVLYEAILGGHTQLGLDRVVSTLLLRRAFTDALEKRGSTPLIYACESGHLSVVNTLLTAGANVTIRSIGGYSAPDKAVFNGHIDVIGTLLRHGADVNPCGNDGWTPLHLAAQNDRAAAIDALIQAGANTEAGLGDRLTPLFSATDRGNISAMRALPRRGASLTAQDTDGGTPLHWACYWQVRGVEATVDLLLRWGADETALDNDSKTPADLLDEDDNENDRTTCSEAEIEQQELPPKQPVMHEAILGGHTQLVNDLVLVGPNLDSRDEYGCTPLHVVAIGLDRVVSTLLLHDKCTRMLSMITAWCPNLCTTCLWPPVHLSVVHALLTAGADVTIRDNGGYSALDSAGRFGHIDVIGALLRYGVDVNACGDDGFAPIHVAARRDQAGAINALMQAGANIESSEGGSSAPPLFSATDPRNLKAMNTLLGHGASLTAQDVDGNTPLHLACYRQDSGLEAPVDLLLRWGADETALNNDGKTPADLLDEHDNENDRTTCSEAEIERVRLLLARAPADQARRRRCWLVMLRSFARTTRATTDETGDAHEGSNDAGDRDGGKCKGARRENGESAGGRVRSPMNGAGEVGVDGGAGGLASIVNSVVGLEPEEVFRSIVGFL
ncbi:unnamed protein product [Ectocarpus sp. CCAP 1310/34]|nr:unnamed protein product [Ectocarpus sp. CCAP 1310/34]